MQTQNKVIDLVASVLFLPAMPFLLLAARKRWSLRLARKLQDSAGVTVLRNHYYEPTLPPAPISDPLRARELSGIDWNASAQLAILRRFTFGDELQGLEGKSVNGRSFYFGNRMLGPGDAEALYSFIRAFRPRTLIEIGAGFSTLVARLAFEANRADDNNYACRHICFEPYENPWLEGIGAEIRREKIEDANLSVFRDLVANDIVFIDSSHVLRTGGDVECEFLRILPTLPRGVLVQIHDIFTPRDYPIQWLREDRRLWTEQYILEAFLTLNREFEIVLALNDLYHSHKAELTKAFPVLAIKPIGPSAFWMRKKEL